MKNFFNIINGPEIVVPTDYINSLNYLRENDWRKWKSFYAFDHEITDQEFQKFNLPILPGQRYKTCFLPTTTQTPIIDIYYFIKRIKNSINTGPYGLMAFFCSLREKIFLDEENFKKIPKRDTIISLNSIPSENYSGISINHDKELRFNSFGYESFLREEYDIYIFFMVLK